MENFNKGDLVRWPSSHGLPDVLPSRETKIGILIKKVDKHEEKEYYLYDRWVVLSGEKEHIVTESLLEKLSGAELQTEKK